MLSMVHCSKQAFKIRLAPCKMLGTLSSITNTAQNYVVLVVPNHQFIQREFTLGLLLEVRSFHACMKFKTTQKLYQAPCDFTKKFKKKKRKNEVGGSEISVFKNQH